MKKATAIITALIALSAITACSNDGSSKNATDLLTTTTTRLTTVGTTTEYDLDTTINTPPTDAT